MIVPPIGFLRLKNSVPRDGPGNWYVPTTLSNFSALSLAAPDYLWKCDEAAGDLAASIGTLSLVANATGHLYQQSVTGWTRPFVGTDGATAGQAWRTTSALLDLTVGKSFAIVAYAAFTVAGTSKTLFAMASGNECLNMSLTTGFLRPLAGAAAVDGTVAHSSITTVRQLCLYRRGDNSTQGAVSNLDAVSNVYVNAARTGQIKGIGPVGATAPYVARYGLFMIFLGTNAERDWGTYLTALRG